MKRTRKASFVLVLSVVLALSLSVTAFAAYATGGSIGRQLGDYYFSAYNNIASDDTTLRAGTAINSDKACPAYHMRVIATLQDDYGNLVTQSAPVENETTTFGIYVTAGKSLDQLAQWMYFSGGTASARGSSSAPYSGLGVVPISPRITAGNRPSNTNVSAHSVNANGQTFGTISDVAAYNNYPDLVGAVGLDGTIGYIYAQDLQDSVMPASREKASELMTSREYIEGRLIDLYASDGVTVVGQFLAGGLIGVTVVEDTVTRTYNEDGTIVYTYGDGTQKTVCWK